MAATMLSTNWTQFIEDLKGIPSTIDSDEIAKPATSRQVAGLENEIGQTLPPAFRKFLLNCSAGVDLSWSLEDGALVKLTGERESVSSGELSFHIDAFLSHNPQFRKNFEPEAYDVQYRPANLLAFAGTPNGDQFAVVLSGAETDAVKYLSHDLDDIHFYTVGHDIGSFLSEYARLGFAGPEYWIWEQFTNGRKTPIDSGSAKASEFLGSIRRGLRSSEAEELYQRATAAARLSRFKHIILPEAQRLRDLKDFDAFVELLSDYSDLLSGSMKSRYEYLLRKKKG
jgi:hypothetical protein